MRLLSALGLLAASLTVTHASAQDLGESFGTPYAPLVREHYYEQLRKRPLCASALELALPGAGTFYVGLRGAAFATFGASLAGAALWVAGAVAERPRLARAGMVSFALVRGYGMAAAPVSAHLLNRALRRQLGYRELD